MPQLSQPIPTRLVGGFLGAGKTTFILEQLKSAGARVAVLVNEFGRLGIDGDLIRAKGGIDVVEMPGGCICCTQRLGLLESIRSIAREIAPELLLIEPSGVAEISELLQVLSDPSLERVIRVDAVITILDAETFLEFSEPEAFGLFFLDQLQSADLIVINKADLVSPELLCEVERRVALLNPAALTVTAEFCQMEQALPQARSRRAPEAHNWTPLGMDCLSVVPGKTFSEGSFAQLLAEIARGRFGRILRGKGFIELAEKGWMNLQLVSGTVRMEPLPSAMPSRLTLIGFALKADELTAFLDGLGPAAIKGRRT
jgi:G3E family GTPase